MEITILILSGIVLVLFSLLVFYKNLKPYKGKKPTGKAKPVSSQKEKIPCLLCGAKLQNGERLKSESYSSGEESIVYMYGCPHCYGDIAVNPRKCPQCGKILGDKDHLIGKMQKGKSGKLHLRISGCNTCVYDK